MGVWRMSLVLAVLVAGWPLSAHAALKDSDCLDCHSDKTLSKTNAAGSEISLFVDVAKLAGLGPRDQFLRQLPCRS